MATPPPDKTTIDALGALLLGGGGGALLTAVLPWIKELRSRPEGEVTEGVLFKALEQQFRDMAERYNADRQIWERDKAMLQQTVRNLERDNRALNATVQQIVRRYPDTSFAQEIKQRHGDKPQ